MRQFDSATLTNFMQSFLPFSDFTKSAKSLDYRRQGKMRVEAKQIYFALTQDNYGWKNHPAVKMWRGHLGALAQYGLTICTEWRARGYQDNQLPFFLERVETNCVMPNWMGNPDFHLSHQSNLVRKNPEYYSPQFPGVPDNLPYVWPV